MTYDLAAGVWQDPSFWKVLEIKRRALDLLVVTRRSKRAVRRESSRRGRSSMLADRPEGEEGGEGVDLGGLDTLVNSPTPPARRVSIVDLADLHS